MKKTTVYLTDELADAIKSQAKVENCSEAEIIRGALEAKLNTTIKRPLPKFGLLGGGQVLLDDLDSLLVGFGEEN